MVNAAQNEPWIHAPGEARGRYEIVARIARGGYGEVYEVRDEAGARWALKLLRLARTRDLRAARRAVFEAMLLKRIDHVHVVRYRDAFVEDDGTVGLVTELLPGVSLRQALTKGPLAVERALRLGRQICDAAAAVHAIGVVHRDIKPENLLLMPPDVVKLVDFGLAKCAGVELRTTRPVGTPLYMAPDQLAYRPSSGAQPDPRWDVYSIGLILLELILGRHPFELDPSERPSAAVIIDRHFNLRVPLLSELRPGFPPRVAQAIAWAIEKKPEHRYPSAEAFSKALSAERGWWVSTFESEPSELTAELRRLDADALGSATRREGEGASTDLFEGPLSEDAATLERPRPPINVAETPAFQLKDPSQSIPRRAPGVPRYGTQPMMPWIDPALGPARGGPKED